MSRSKTTGSTVTSDTAEDGKTTVIDSTAIDTNITVVLIYDTELNEVGVTMNQVTLPSDNVDAMLDKEMTDLGWTYSKEAIE